MVKLIFLIFLSSFIGVISAPEFLMADNLSVKSPGADAVLTIEPEPVVEVTNTEVAYSATSVYTPAPILPTNYSVSYYIGSVAEFNNTAYNLSYTGLYKYNKMIYGHNSYNLLGSLSNRYVGEVITITEGGVSASYQVTGVQIYRKTEDGNLEYNPRLMSQIANTALGNDIALFTCYGESYGNGDASHRLVVFANCV